MTDIHEDKDKNKNRHKHKNKHEHKHKHKHKLIFSKKDARQNTPTHLQRSYKYTGSYIQGKIMNKNTNTYTTHRQKTYTFTYIHTFYLSHTQAYR